MYVIYYWNWSANRQIIIIGVNIKQSIKCKKVSDKIYM